MSFALGSKTAPISGAFPLRTCSSIFSEEINAMVEDHCPKVFGWRTRFELEAKYADMLITQNFDPEHVAVYKEFLNLLPSHEGDPKQQRVVYWL